MLTLSKVQAQKIVKKAKVVLMQRGIAAVDGSGERNVESLLILASEAARGQLKVV